MTTRAALRLFAPLSVLIIVGAGGICAQTAVHISAPADASPTEIEAAAQSAAQQRGCNAQHPVTQQESDTRPYSSTVSRSFAAIDLSNQISHSALIVDGKILSLTTQPPDSGTGKIFYAVQFYIFETLYAADPTLAPEPGTTIRLSAFSGLRLRPTGACWKLLHLPPLADGKEYIMFLRLQGTSSVPVTVEPETMVMPDASGNAWMANGLEQIFPIGKRDEGLASIDQVRVQITSEAAKR